eukprot:UN26740
MNPEKFRLYTDRSTEISQNQTHKMKKTAKMGKKIPEFSHTLC